jgi:phenylpropionate dioxygenase-like ring-hydroxylating dioxygenase large terminal subunit
MTTLTESAPATTQPRRATIDLEAEADLARCGALKDFWYVACTSEELGAKKPIARTILGVPIALFRAAGGAPAALRDRCLHRNAQISRGDVLDGGRLGCPYHGWTYDGSGRCVEIPSLGPSQRGEVLDEAGHTPTSAACRATPSRSRTDSCSSSWATIRCARAARRSAPRTGTSPAGSATT